MSITYLDGVWYTDENDDFLPISRYEAVDLFIRAIQAGQDSKMGEMMEILCMEDTYTVEEATQIMSTRLQELSKQAKLDIDLPDLGMKI